MAHEMPGFSFTALAATDMTGKTGYGVVINNLNQVALAGASASIDGVIRYEGLAGQAVTVVKTGEMGVILGGPVTMGDPLAVAAGGAFIKATTGMPIVAVSRRTGLIGEMHEVLLGYKGNA